METKAGNPHNVINPGLGLRRSSVSEGDFFGSLTGAPLNDGPLPGNDVAAAPGVSERENRSLINRVVSGVNNARRNIIRQNQTYADQALKTPANFLNWLFRFCFVYSLMTLGAVIGQHFGCLMKEGDVCKDDITTLLQKKVGSIVAWISGIIVSAVLDLCARRLWDCFSHKVDSCLERGQNWAKRTKCRVAFFLGAFYLMMTAVAGGLAIIAERYGEGKVWPKNSSSPIIAVAVGGGAGVLGSIVLLIIPKLKKIKLSNIVCCKSLCNGISRLLSSARGIASSICRKITCQKKRRNSDDSGDLGLEVHMLEQDNDIFSGGANHPHHAAGVGLPLSDSPIEVVVADEGARSAGFVDSLRRSPSQSDLWTKREDARRIVNDGPAQVS